MEILKKLTLFIGTTVAAIFLIVWLLDSYGFRSPISAFLINWMILSWIALITQIVHLSFPLTYYDSKPFERTGQIYELVGIRIVKKLLRRGPLRIFSPTLKFPKERTVSALRNLENEMRKAETAHTLTFILMLLFIGYAVSSGWLDSVLWMLCFNILINIYPIMLQRYNRIKLQELISTQQG